MRRLADPAGSERDGQPAFGANPRFLVANLDYPNRHPYETVYCARGDMENWIKDQQLTRSPGSRPAAGSAANQFRQLLSGLAYTLIEGLCRLA